MIKPEKFYTQYDRPLVQYEKNDGPILVENAPLATTEERVEALMLAGRRLVDYRLQQNYDAPDGVIPEGEINLPPDRLNLDMAELSQMAIKSESIISEAEKIASNTSQDQSKDSQDKTPGHGSAEDRSKKDVQK